MREEVDPHLEEVPGSVVVEHVPPHLVLFVVPDPCHCASSHLFGEVCADAVDCCGRAAQAHLAVEFIIVFVAAPRFAFPAYLSVSFFDQRDGQRVPRPQAEAGTALPAPPPVPEPAVEAGLARHEVGRVQEQTVLPQG